MEARQFVCYHGDCGKIFTTKYNLVRHINTLHLGILEHSCTQCNRSFTSKGGLESHLLSHKRKSGRRVRPFPRSTHHQPNVNPQPHPASQTPKAPLTPLSLPQIAGERQSMATIPVCSKLIKRLAQPVEEEY